LVDLFELYDGKARTGKL